MNTEELATTARALRSSSSSHSASLDADKADVLV